jgi:hypothetical protein
MGFCFHFVAGGISGTCGFWIIISLGTGIEERKQDGSKEYRVERAEFHVHSLSVYAPGRTFFAVFYLDPQCAEFITDLVGGYKVLILFCLSPQGKNQLHHTIKCV